jgi:hypothetical protein
LTFSFGFEFGFGFSFGFGLCYLNFVIFFFVLVLVLLSVIRTLHFPTFLFLTRAEQGVNLNFSEDSVDGQSFSDSNRSSNSSTENFIDFVCVVHHDGEQRGME